MAEPSNALKQRREGAVQIITFNRPDRRNAWSSSCARAMVEAMLAANADPDVGAVVWTGEGEYYCAGTDLKASERDPETGRRLTPATFTMGAGDYNWVDLLARSKPVVAAINGPAIGIGATHILAADIRIAARSASFSFPFLKIGAMPECGSSALLPRLIGAGRATDLLLRSRKIDAARALEWGLVTEVVPDEELLATALAIAGELAAAPALQMRLTKRMLSADRDAAAVMKTENDAFLELLKALGRDRTIAD